MQQEHSTPNALTETHREQEPIDFLTAKNSLTDQVHPDGVYTLGNKEVLQLDCLAFVRQGAIIPLIDLTGIPIPESPEGKMYFSVFIAQHIMNNVLDALEIMQGKPK